MPYLWEVHAESVHVQSVQEAGEALTEARQTLVHQLQVHEIGFKIGHGVGQLGELWFQGIDRGLRVP